MAKAKARARVFGLVGAVMLAGIAATTVAASGILNASPPPAPSPSAQENRAYNGKFVFARIRYQMGGGGGMGRGFRGGGGEPPWHHDYPYAEFNLMSILKNVSTVVPGHESGNIIDIGDPELHKYPLSYMSEPGYWTMDEKELTNFRTYLQKGGFLIVDDFNRNQWGNFAAQMQRLFPELEPIVLDATHPIFQSFFEMESLNNLYGSYAGDGEPPVFVGYFEENDINNRMIAIVNFKNDLGENWEYESRGFNMIPEAANEAFKFGINYILYALTH